MTQEEEVQGEKPRTVSRREMALLRKKLIPSGNSRAPSLASQPVWLATEGGRVDGLKGQSARSEQTTLPGTAAMNKIPTSTVAGVAGNGTVSWGHELHAAPVSCDHEPSH